MSQAAYEVNGQIVASDLFYQVACDPHRSVVVEACAGAGKTWMLVSRILRALLDDVPPNQILAITFTKKAAGEMRERLHGWLRDFALASEERREMELRIRGVQPAQIAAMVPKLQQLYERWLDEGRGVDIHTIHGWFSRLVKAAPLDILNELGLPPELNLVEDTSEHWPELWGRFLRRVDAQSPGKRTGDEAGGDYLAFMSIVREVGRFNTEAWLSTALSNRLELSLADKAGHLIDGVETAADWSLQWAGLAHPCEALSRASVQDQFWSLARQLATGKTATQQKAGVAIEQAMGLTDLQARHKALRKVLLTDKGEPRKKMGELADLEWAQAWLVDLQLAITQQEGHVLHGHMVSLSRLLFEEYAKFKTERGLADMVDLELAAARLLGDPELSGWVQERLDSQVRQLLMDEFQDTSPLQWQTLKSWLSAYAGAGGGQSGRQPISVFLVGDPKQSIYRFRRADPRVFSAAKDFVLEALDGDLLACDHTRRNAPGIIDALNKVMGQACAEGSFPGFRPHTTTSEDVATIRVLPSVMRTTAAKDEPEASWRDSLITPREQAHTTIKEIEAEQVAQAIAAMVFNDGLAPSDIYVLSRKRATLSLVAQALDEHGVPHIAPEDTRLIDTPEVRDLVAVLDALVSPQHDLALAHALKSPLFGASDADLLGLAWQVRQAKRKTSWWDALMQWGGDEACPTTLARAATLLQAWAELARVAPPHDLLERIVTNGAYRARLLSCVPASRRVQALFHVDALLSQSLEMDAGRDATPYRWVRALKRLPLNLPPRAQADAVQLLTIHGAKGLEAKVVFMVDTDPEPSRKDSYALMVDWPESDERPRRCAFIRSQSNPPPSLARTLEEDHAANLREELNALYVALTRAREQLVFSRTQPRGSPEGSWWQRLVSSGAMDPEQVWQPATPLRRSVPEDEASTTVRSLNLPALQPLTSAPDETRRVVEESSVQQLLGQVVHRTLEWLTPLPLHARTAERVAKATQSAAKALQLAPEHHDAALHLATTILKSPSLQPWLDPALLDWAGNEVALHDGEQVLRIDRLVAVRREAGREWWVLDYKLQHRPQALASYRAQMQRYVAAVEALQPDEPVRAAFITGAGEWVPLD
ncbi:MAG: UvrD-helicase domain-containing protein [Aquabacterium sp.]|uniref:UvrD-helicase domain-containing protein n=1 Tax=Aquabacterium sp. TaxID=1872578 RepID=UPI0025B8BA6E|nr:UvrD-helicase domain-containing protein [Aquabacterium sp.]MBI5927266.1 UvrD-helicase domain-containing protein [Aquabacterium sp.]